MTHAGQKSPPVGRASLALALVLLSGCPGDEGGGGGGGQSELDAGDVLTFPDEAFDAVPAPMTASPGNTPSTSMTSMMTMMGAMRPTDTPPPPSAGAMSMGVGEPCDVSGDCADGLECHQDLESYISHGQCTTSCTSSEACTAAWGELTMCIGAELCVARCLLDSDCPELTRCGDAGWCERTGVGSGNPYCLGSPTPCSLLSGSQCLSSLGCRDDSDCTGLSTSCYSIFNSSSCISQDGCYWSSSSSDCSGSAWSCSTMSGQFSCTSQDGCSWRNSCTGTPLTTDCEDESVGLCEFTPGCTVIYP